MIDDVRRLAALGSIDLDSAALRERLDAVTQRTAERLGLPISLVSMVLDTAQLFIGAHGIGGWLADVGGTPIEWSFCAQVVSSGQPYVVPDARLDHHQKENPLVTVDGVRSYAGAPIIVDGVILGAHCVFGDLPHDFSDDDLAELRRSADEIAQLLASNRLPPAA